MKRLLILLFYLALSFAASGSQELAGSPEALVLERIFTTDEIDKAWFSEAFLAQVSAAQLTTIIQQIGDELGAFLTVEGEASPFTLVFERGTATAQLHLDQEGRVSGLLFTELIPTVEDLEQALAGFRQLEGEVSVLVLEGDLERAELNADASLAVGSSFKLLVLAALQEEIAAGHRAWSEVVQLEPSWKSLPSGIMQDWPDGAQVTLETLATLMISLSDNTATDALMHTLGRARLEARSEKNRPFLSTREFFALKNPENETFLLAYREADEAARRTILDKLAERPLPAPELFLGDPVATDVEWFFTVRELCGLMAEVQAVPLMGVNPGVVNPNAWAKVAFKGGSEPGVLNLTTWLERTDGTAYCVSATQNRADARLEETRFVSLYNGLVAALGSRD